jgi:hypothetical protein
MYKTNTKWALRRSPMRDGGSITEQPSQETYNHHRSILETSCSNTSGSQPIRFSLQPPACLPSKPTSSPIRDSGCHERLQKLLLVKIPSTMRGTELLIDCKGARGDSTSSLMNVPHLSEVSPVLIKQEMPWRGYETRAKTCYWHWMTDRKILLTISKQNN